jgi:CNP1-like family
MIKRPLPTSAALALWLSALLICSSAWAEPAASGQDPQAAESELALPSPAQKSNLLPFYVSPTTTMDFSIDAKSLSVTPDGIVRFTLVITSKTGASNISYEGIRCATEEKKLYATGKPDGSWSPSRRDIWSPISDVGANRQHAALMKDYFCEGTTVAGKAETIIERIRKQKPLK